MTSIIKVDTLQTAAGGVPTVADLGLNVTGSVLQVKQAVKTNTQSSQGFNFVDASGLSVTITPRSSDSMFLVSFRLILSADYYASYMRLMRGANAIFTGDSSGSRFTGTSQIVSSVAEANAHGFIHHHVAQFVDEPNTTSAITYKLQFSGRVGFEGYSGTTYVNRAVSDRNFPEYDSRLASNIIVQEIAG